MMSKNVSVSLYQFRNYQGYMLLQVSIGREYYNLNSSLDGRYIGAKFTIYTVKFILILRKRFLAKSISLKFEYVPFGVPFNLNSLIIYATKICRPCV